MQYLKINKPLIILVAIILLFGAGIFVFFRFKLHSVNTLAQTHISVPDDTAKPAVLGEFTSVRGVATATPVTFTQIKTNIDTSEVTAKSFLVYDLETGQALAQRKADTEVSIASLTKLLTALVAYENLDLNSGIIITSKDIFNVSPDLNLRIRDRIQVVDLFNAMLIGSNNDAAQTLANHVASSTGINFVQLMNQKAGKLGMADSHFSNPLGFDSQYNFSTARDLQKLINVTQNLAAFTNLGKSSRYSFQSQLGNLYSTVATNKLIKSYQDLEAVKTGFTENSGGSMISKLNKDEHKIIIIVLESQDREGDTLKLRDIILNDFVVESK